MQNDHSKSISHPSPSIVRKILFLFLVMRTFKIYSQQINNCCFLVAELCLFVIPWTIARQAPLSMGFSRQEYWSGLPFPSLGDLLNPWIEPASIVYFNMWFYTGVDFDKEKALANHPSTLAWKIP